MQQQRSQRPAARPAHRNEHVPHDTNTARIAEHQPAKGVDSDAETRQALAVLTEKVERLTEKVEKLKEVKATDPTQSQAGHHGDWLGRLLNGRFNGLLAFGSSAITVLTLLFSLSFGWLKRLPTSPGTVYPWSLADLLRPLIPEVIAIALVAILIPTSRLLKPKSRRMKFLTGLMGCYSAATVLYLAWLSLSFLHYDTLPSGVLLTLTWVSIVLILRRAPAEVAEMRELIRVQSEKEAQQGKALVPPPPSKSA